METVALIPAKCRSRRLPNKNVLQLKGYPLFYYSIQAASLANHVSHVFVSSDSQEILDASADYGADTIARPPELGADHVTNFHVCRHAVSEIRSRGIPCESLLLLQPTHPFRTPEGIDQAVQRLEEEPTCDSLVSVKRVHRASGVIREGRWRSMRPLGERLANPEEEYAITGHLFLFRVDRTLEKETFLGTEVLPWMLPEEWLDIDIDYVADFRIAQELSKAFVKTHLTP